jgi:hypothetical protein
LDESGKIEIEPLVFADADDDNTHNGQYEEHETDHREQIEIHAVFTANVAKQIGRNHAGHLLIVNYILGLYFLRMASVLLGYTLSDAKGTISDAK